MHSLVHICLLAFVDIVYMAAARACVLGIVGTSCTNTHIVGSSCSLCRSMFEQMDLQIFFGKYLKQQLCDDNDKTPIVLSLFFVFIF
jgi:hypothetical protein